MEHRGEFQAALGIGLRDVSAGAGTGGIRKQEEKGKGSRRGREKVHAGKDITCGRRRPSDFLYGMLTG
jgi:hypothetical protein